MYCTRTHRLATQSTHLVPLHADRPSPTALAMVDDSAWTVWDDVTSRAALDRDGIPILYHFPISLLKLDVVQFTKSCLSAVEEISLTFEAGWTVLVSLGSFSEGGYVKIPRLGLRVRFLPEDVLVLRGVFLECEVEVWSGGQRISLEHFSRDSLWKYVNVEL